MIPQGSFIVLAPFLKERKLFGLARVIGDIEEMFKGFLLELREFTGHNPHIEFPVNTSSVNVKSSASFLLVINLEV